MCKKENEEGLLKKLNEKGIEVDEGAELILAEKNFFHGDYFSVKYENKIVIIKREEILYFQAEGKDIYCYDMKRKYKVDKKLYEIENLLYKFSFVRINKSSIVNVLEINEIIPWIGSKYIVVMNNKDELDVTRTYYRAFKGLLGL